MPTIVTATELRTILGVSSSLYSDAYLNEIIDASENIILPMLVRYASPIAKAELTDNVALFTTSTQHEFSVGQSVVIAGVSAVFNGTRVITDVSDDRYEFSAAITNADITEFNVIPAGSATLTGAATYVGNANVKTATLVISTEIFQAKTAVGGSIEGVDFAVTPFRLSKNLLAKVTGLLGPYIDVEVMVG